ncbi:phosphotransferase [soil metagenome]
MVDFRQRLEQFLKERKQSTKIVQLTPDASTREYFRVEWNASTAIGCVYPDSFISAEQTYIDVTNVFHVGGLPVAEIYDFDENLGVILLEDFGDTILRDVLLSCEKEEKEKLLNQAISLIAQIQAATPKAFELNSISSQLKFDTEKLLWELNFFKTHYFETLRKSILNKVEDSAVSKEFSELSADLETQAKFLCHRDFHAANLMIDRENYLRIIDHQDARIGSVAYDLVSLLLDRVTKTPSNEWLEEKKRFFLNERERFDLERINFKDFDHEFQLMTIQRCLKAIGTFSFQSVNRGKTHFIQYINPMFQIVLFACQKLNKFPVLQNIIKKQIEN